MVRLSISTVCCMALSQNPIGALLATRSALTPSIMERMARSATPLRSLIYGGEVCCAMMCSFSISRNLAETNSPALSLW